MKYNSDMLDEMAENIDLLEYAENSMEFVIKSGRYFTNCPLHVDNTPSLCVDPELNRWYCHSCHKGGYIYQWFQYIEGMSFPEAVEKVADMTGVDATQYMVSDTVNVYKEINRCKNKKVIEIPERKILDFQADYLDAFEPELPQEWIDEGIDPEVMKKYNIMISKKHNRIVYPVLDQAGKFISVKGRTRFDNYKAIDIAKYLNLFPIGAVDYFQGYQQAEEEIKRKKSIIIFEGIKSCMKSYGWGIKNTVASETSDLSEGQLRLLIKYGLSEVIIAWDNDKLFKDIVNNKKIQALKRFTKVSIINDRNRLLGTPEDKMAPVDAGEQIYRKLLEERMYV